MLVFVTPPVAGLAIIVVLNHSVEKLREMDKGGVQKKKKGINCR